MGLKLHFYNQSYECGKIVEIVIGGKIGLKYYAAVQMG